MLSKKRKLVNGLVSYFEDNEKELNDQFSLDLINLTTSLFYDEACLPEHERKICNRTSSGWMSGRSFRHTTLFTDDPGELIDEEVPKNETDTEVDGCGQSQEWDHGIRPVSPSIIGPGPRWWERGPEVVTFIPPSLETDIADSVKEKLGCEFPHALGKQVEELMAYHWEKLRRDRRVGRLEDSYSQFNSMVADAQVGLMNLCRAFYRRRMNATSTLLDDAVLDMKDAAREVFGRHCSDIESSSSDSPEEGPSDRTGLKGPSDRTGLKGPSGRVGLKGPSDRTGLKGPSDRTGLKGPSDRAGLKGPSDRVGLKGESQTLILSTENAARFSSSTDKTSKGKQKRRTSKLKIVSTDRNNSSSSSSEESSSNDSSSDGPLLTGTPSRTKRLLKKPRRRARRKNGNTRTSRKRPHSSTDSDSTSEEPSLATPLKRPRFSHSDESEQEGNAVSVDSVCATPTGTRHSQRLAQRTSTPNYREDKMFS